MSQATLRDLCAEAVNVYGTGAATFLGAMRGHRTFAVAYAGALPLPGVRIKIEELNSQGIIVRWEDSECTVSEAGFTRDTCINSSNNGAFVEFGAGYKRAFVFIPVADVGGSGAVTSVAGRTGAVTLSASDISGLGTAATTAASAYATAAQGTDDRTASGLRTATTVVSVSAATAPSAGQTLVATSSTAATWQTPAGGISIGDSVGGGIANRIPFIDASGNLAQGADFYYAGGALYVPFLISAPNVNTDNLFFGGTSAIRGVSPGRLTVGIGAAIDAGVIELTAIRKKPYTVGTVPLSRAVGDVFEVVDALAPAVFSPVVAGGSVTTDVRWDGTNLIVKG